MWQVEPFSSEDTRCPDTDKPTAASKTILYFMCIRYKYDDTPVTSRHWADAVLLLSQRRRRWLNIKTALVQCRVFAGTGESVIKLENILSHIIIIPLQIHRVKNIYILNRVHMVHVTVIFIAVNMQILNVQVPHSYNE